jgi:hypothetical protein
LPKFEQLELDEPSLLRASCFSEMASDEFLIIRVVHTTRCLIRKCIKATV